MHNFHRFNLQDLYFAVFSNKILKPNYILLRDFMQGFYVQGYSKWLSGF